MDDELQVCRRAFAATGAPAEGAALAAALLRAGQLEPGRLAWAAACPRDCAARRVALLTGVAPAPLPDGRVFAERYIDGAAQFTTETFLWVAGGCPDVRWQAAVLTLGRLLGPRELRRFACAAARRSLASIHPREREVCADALRAGERFAAGAAEPRDLQAAHDAVDAADRTRSERAVDRPGELDPVERAALHAVRAALRPGGPEDDALAEMSELQGPAGTLARHLLFDPPAGVTVAQAAIEAATAVALAAAGPPPATGSVRVWLHSHWRVEGDDAARAAAHRALDGRAHPQDLVPLLSGRSRRLGLTEGRFRFLRNPNHEALFGVATFEAPRRLAPAALAELEGEVRGLLPRLAPPPEPRVAPLASGPADRMTHRQVAATWTDLALGAARAELGWQDVQLCEALLPLSP